MNDIRAAAVQAREADYLARLNFLRRLSPEDLLEELLAVIHGDGGNYSDAHGLARAVADAEVKYHAIAAAPAPQPLSEEQKREIILRIIGKDDPVSAITAYRIIHETLHMLSPSPQQDGPSDAPRYVWAWMHEEDEARVISAAQKAQALSDGGASASSVRPYSVPLYRVAVMRGDTGGKTE